MQGLLCAQTEAVATGGARPGEAQVSQGIFEHCGISSYGTPHQLT